MKTIFTLALLTISYLSFAHPDDGKLSITNLGARSILVEVDGKRINSRVNADDDFILVPALSTGLHSVKIYALATSRNDNNNRNDINANRGKPVLIFQRNLNIRVQYHVDIVINRFGKVLYDELSMRDRNYVDVQRRDDGQYGRPDRPERPDRGTPSDSDNGYGRAMQPQSFSAFKETLSKERFDNARVTIAKQVIDQNYFTADQVKQLAQLFSSDNNKLEVAKYAYRNTVNRQDYFIVYEVFSFSSSKEDLANYIRQFK